MADELLGQVKVLHELIEDKKEHMSNGLYVRLCNAMQRVYNHAKTLESVGDEEGEGEEEESDEELGERTDEDMER